MKEIAYLAVSLCLFLSACSRTSSLDSHDHTHGESCTHDHSHDHDHDHDHDEHCAHDHEGDYAGLHDLAITFTQIQQGKIDFATDIPRKETFGQVIRATAQVQPSQSDAIVIAAKSGGIVSFGGKNLVEGQAVAAGQSLLVISGEGLSDNNMNVRYAEAKAAYQKAEDAYKRAAALVEDKIISQRAFVETRSEYETAKAVYDNLARYAGSKGLSVIAPQSGYIQQLWVDNGAFVEEGQALVSIIQNKSLLIKADVASKYASLLPTISDATFRVNGNTLSLKSLNGKVLSYGKVLREDNYMLPVTFQVDHAPQLLPGAFLETYIKTQGNQEVMTLPNSALTEEQGLFFVYVQLTPEAFEKREVTVGATDGIRTEIRSGIAPDERVVTQGAVSVKLAQSAGALDPHAGHVH